MIVIDQLSWPLNYCLIDNTHIDCKVEECFGFLRNYRFRLAVNLQRFVRRSREHVTKFQTQVSSLTYPENLSLTLNASLVLLIRIA
jgi:hypothetical protein